MPTVDGPQNRRFGEAVSNDWTRFMQGIIAAQSAPTVELQCVDLGKFRRARWVVVLPALGAGCTLVVGRWVSANVSGTVVSSFVEDADIAIDHNTRQYEHNVDGDRVAAYVRDLTGTWTAGGAILVKGCN